jgi:hypothetical protein
MERTVEQFNTLLRIARKQRALLLKQHQTILKLRHELSEAKIAVLLGSLSDEDAQVESQQ